MAGKTRYTPARAARICEGLRAGLTHKAAASCGGVCRDTFYHWRNTRPDFAAMARQAEAICACEMVAIICAAAKAGNWRAALWWLERRWPGDWGR